MPEVSRESDFEAFQQAIAVAAKRIIPNRRKLSLKDAEDIVRMELERHDVSHVAGERIAKALHRGPAWPFLHPLRARRERMTFSLWRP